VCALVGGCAEDMVWCLSLAIVVSIGWASFGRELLVVRSWPVLPSIMQGTGYTTHKLGFHGHRLSSGPGESGQGRVCCSVSPFSAAMPWLDSVLCAPVQLPALHCPWLYSHCRMRRRTNLTASFEGISGGASNRSAQVLLPM
jgi:hypothetical protein